jgi:hypothetical protein
MEERNGGDMSVSDWFEAEGATTHWCGGTTDDKKMNKADPRLTQTALTNWFNPTTLDEETGVLTCNACGASPKDGEVKTTIEIHNVGE